MDTGLHGYRITWILDFTDIGLHGYLITWKQNYRITWTQDYYNRLCYFRVTRIGRQGFKITKDRDTREQDTLQKVII